MYSLPPSRNPPHHNSSHHQLGVARTFSAPSQPREHPSPRPTPAIPTPFVLQGLPAPPQPQQAFGSGYTNSRRMSISQTAAGPYPGSHSNPPPPPLTLGQGPPMQGPSVLQILQTGQDRNHAADAMAHHPRIESLIKLAKESEATWLQIGGTAEALGDLERAVASYESALRHNAYSVQALSHVAAICRSKEEFKKAAEYFGRVVGIAPESGDVWGALGHCYLMMDDLKKAYSSYQQALYYMSNPQEPKLWYGIGILYDRYGSLEHAEEAFSSVIRMDPNFEKANEIFFRLGIIYKQQRKSQQSLECFRYILQNPPRPLTEIDIWFQIGHVYEQQKDFIAAKESYDRVLAENPAHAKVLQQLGGLYHRARAPFYNPEISVQILTKSLESDANDPFSWYLLGRAYMTTSNYGKAYEAYQQAVYRDGKNPAFWCSIGVLYYNINQFHDALDAYSRAIRIHPYLSEVWFNLGALYESCNDQMTDAIDAYQRTLQLEPANALVASRLREIHDHQATGAPLSTPPQPKDISPSSVSWNYATNAGGAPAHLNQGGPGLGLELSPALGRPPAGNNGAPSPPSSHRFEVAPPMGLGRPHSTDSFRMEDRRRHSGGLVAQHSPTTSMESPRATHRLSGPSQTVLPQIKGISENRGSPPVPSGSDIHRRHSPPSPRSRHPEGFEHGYAPPPPNNYHGGPPGFPSAFSRGGPESNDRGERGNEMEWERPMGGARNSNSLGLSAGRGSTQLHRRSPPGSSHSRNEQQQSSHYAVPPPPLMYDRRIPSPGTSRLPPQDDRDQRDSRNGRVSPYPPPFNYNYGGSFEQQQRRYDPRHERNERNDRMAEREQQFEEEDRRRGAALSGARADSPRSAPVFAQPEAGPSNAAQAHGSGPGNGSMPAANGKGTGRKGKRDETVASPSTSARKEANPPKSRKAKDPEGPPPAKKERKPPAKGKEAGPGTPSGRKPRANGNGSANGAPRLPDPSNPPSPTGSSPHQPDSMQGPSSNHPSREVDEDYDEGVDALMGLASSGSTSSHDRDPSPARTVLGSAALPPLPVQDNPPTASPTEGNAEVDEASSSVPVASPPPNPRKRSLASPLPDALNKRVKAEENSTTLQQPSPDVIDAAAAQSTIDASPAPLKVNVTSPTPASALEEKPTPPEAQVEVERGKENGGSAVEEQTGDSGLISV